MPLFLSFALKLSSFFFQISTVAEVQPDWSSNTAWGNSGGSGNSGSIDRQTSLDQVGEKYLKFKVHLHGRFPSKLVHL
jgi:hypothetical protein